MAKNLGASGQDYAGSLLVAQQRYLEAWRDASQIMVDAMQTVIGRQLELAELGMRELWGDSSAMLRPGAGGYRPGEQAERVREFYQRAFDSCQELSDIMLKAQSEAMRTLTDGAASAVKEAKAA